MARYDPRTALVVVDVQHDFADPAGSLYVEGGEDVVPAANREIAAAREAGALVVYTQDWHPESTPHFANEGGRWPVHCVRGTWGAELHRDLDVDGPVVRKGTSGEDGYSGFTVRDPVSGQVAQTGLDPLLRNRDVERVVIVGIAADVCVKETALDARRFAYDTTVLADAVRAVDPGAGLEGALDDLRAAGVTVG